MKSVRTEPSAQLETPIHLDSRASFGRVGSIMQVPCILFVAFLSLHSSLAFAVEVRGSLSKDEIQQVIRASKKSFSACYQSASKSEPKLEGRVAVKFVIDGAGTVAEANIADNTTGNVELASCVVENVKKLRFPEPKGGGKVIITYPWAFKPSGS